MTIKEQNRQFIVQSQYGTYNINNRKSAEQLDKTLTDYKKLVKQSLKTEQTLDRVTKKVIQAQMTLTILQDEFDKLKKELDI